MSGCDFMGTTLPWLREKGVRVGMDWAGRQLRGPDATAEQLLLLLNYWLSRSA